ncbi:hypothetical protein [Thermoanaerobacterium sp. R66]|uniref:hypothetical protein n=1 Tax=Thermoanaerobacterium sp. R66 TaxID=2742479 RepID=UPI002380099E|nr:hypothetical protein [Thermoanaerobacterium sp. R66]MDE4542287.1 hypothetical protein [Thermoanaerobacterium sp. R66]
MDTQEMKIIHLYDKQPKDISVKLEKNTKGYNWEISYAGEDIEVVLARIREANKKLQEEYGGEKQ